jgi:cytochrome c biogenesis protein CcdA
MKHWQSSYWKFFNVLGRIVGVVFMMGGVIISLCSLTSLIGSKHDSFTKWGGTSIGLVVVFLGILLFKARPSNPTKFREKIIDKLKD